MEWLAILLKAFETLLPLLLDCLNQNTPEGMVEFARRRPRVAEFAVRRHLVRRGVSASDARAEASSIMSAVRQASDEELVELATLAKEAA